jgi:hypothetical protein
MQTASILHAQSKDDESDASVDIESNRQTALKGFSCCASKKMSDSLAAATPPDVERNLNKLEPMFHPILLMESTHQYMIPLQFQAMPI